MAWGSHLLVLGDIRPQGIQVELGNGGQRERVELLLLRLPGGASKQGIEVGSSGSSVGGAGLTLLIISSIKKIYTKMQRAKVVTASTSLKKIREARSSRWVCSNVLPSCSECDPRCWTMDLGPSLRPVDETDYFSECLLFQKISHCS